MIVDIFAFISSLVFCLSGVILLVWFLKSDLKKTCDELQKKNDDLLIVNKNLAKFNEQLLKNNKGE